MFVPNAAEYQKAQKAVIPLAAAFKISRSYHATVKTALTLIFRRPRLTPNSIRLKI